MRILAILLSAAITLIAASAYAGFFSPGFYWSDDAVEFYDDWFGEQLTRMGEPSLWRLHKAGTDETHIRLFIVPTWTASYAIHITEKPDGTGALVYTKLSGAGGYDYGTVAEKAEKPLSAQQLQHSVRQTRSFRRWEAEMEWIRRHNPYYDHMIADGTGVIVEFVHQGRYHFISVAESYLDRIRGLDDLVQALHESADIPYPPPDIY